MERTAFPDDAAVQRRVRIVGSELVENYTVYIIEVTVGSHQWSIKHRYSDFHELHEKLTAEKKIDKNLLPPKKMIGKNSRSLVEKRQKELEVYLETLLVKFPFAAPKEINGITAALAEELFHKGEQLLVAGEVFLLRPLQLYAITQQLRLATPTCANGDAKADLGHILDFTCRLKYLKIPGTRGTVGTSNIQEHLLPFDLSIFKSLLQIEISHCESQQIKGLPSLKPSLATMSIHYCAASMKDILVPEASEFAQWEVEGVASDCPVTAVIPTWKMLTTLDMSHNSLKCIDESVKLIPKVEFLDLSYNDLTLVENLQHLYNLIHLDLSYNKLTTLEGVHTKLGNIKTLNLAGNQLESLLGLNKLYSLVNLDLSSNKLAQLDEIKNIGTLPCLEKLSLTNNPMCIIPDYRTKVLAQFWDRASEVCLDRTPTTEKELDTVEVLKAIQKAKEAKDRMANSEKKCGHNSCCGCVEDCAVWLDARSVPVVPLALISYTAASLELAAELSALVGKAARELEKEVCSERDGLSVEGAEPGSPGSGDGYFEVSRGSRDTCQAGGPQAALEEPGPGPVRVSKVVWALGVRVGPSTRHLLACVVLTEPWLAVFRVRNGEQPLGVADIVAELEAELLVPYTDIEAVTLDVPDLCLSLKVRPSGVILYLLSDSQSLMEMHAHLSTLVTGSPPEPQGGTATAQAQLIRQLLNPWEYEANDYVVKGAFPAHLLHSAKVTSEGPPCSDVPSEMWSSGVDEGSASLPCVLFLTPRHLCILRLDFATLAGGPRSSMRLSRVPLASVLVHPRQACYGSGPPPERGFRDGHVLELLAGRELVTAVFLLPHDKFLFLSLFSQLRSGLRDIKTVAFLQARLCHRKNRNHQMHVERTQKVPVNSLPPAVQRPRLKLSLLHPDSSLTRRLSEENQCPSHLALSPSLGFLSGRQGDELLEFFHSSVAEVENEELAHVLWSSVLFYQFPDLELTACIMLSTKALYFILDDSAATLSGQAVLWNWQPTEDQEADFIISYCFAMKLQDLHSVNVGLFDQYFRVVGPSPSHVIACLTRDSYGTHRFLQQLMAVLSSLEKLPSPEPPEQDFYSQFGKNNTGKMKNYELVHSSKVKFVYPSEEEIGDLTFIVAEKKSSCGHSRAFNILLYVLAFQVQSSYPGPGTPPEHHLQPKTLILTSTDVFLLDEDYISYPLPDFAKEPPQRDKYRLTDARRIRDLDRVLMGYQTYPQALTLVFDDIPGPDLLCHLTLDHFAEEGRAGGWGGARASRPSVDQSEVQWCVFVPGADARERLISLLARQWEALCSRELPVELTG
ncbi:nischarin-like [Scleropages formosus]|uniref:Nischarin-like n=1 Tax=Scleropages formosus TaxID=113540 RepID=A0A0P7V0W7_SCLFO|nr:nischarin-like [Scleropages formosus]